MSYGVIKGQTAFAEVTQFITDLVRRRFQSTPAPVETFLLVWGGGWEEEQKVAAEP